MVEVLNGCVDGLVERVDIGEGLMGEVMRLEVVSDDFDIVEFWGVFGQPLYGEPVRASGTRCERAARRRQRGPARLRAPPARGPRLRGGGGRGRPRRARRRPRAPA